MAGLTNQGLEIRRLTEVRDGLREQAVATFSDLLKEGEILDTSSASTLGRLIGIISPSQADLWEALQEVYSAFDPNSATGIALDNLVAFAGIVRKGATASTARILVTGDYNITIPEESLVSSSFTNNSFSIPTDIVLNSDNAVGFTARVQSIQDSTTYTLTYASGGQNPVNLSYTSGVGATEVSILTGLADVINQNYATQITATVEGNTLKVISNDLVSQSDFSLSGNLYFTKITKVVTVVCTEFGPVEQNTGTINTIRTPIFGWDSIEQIAPAIVGSRRETDASLRERFNQSKYSRGSNIAEALYSQLISLNGVKVVKIYENLTNAVDAFGIPPHAFMVLVQGGLESEIAETIWENRPAGIPSFGNSTYLITDVLGNLKEVYFQRPTYVDIYITVDLTVDSDFPPNGVEAVRSEIFNYINNNSEVGEGVVYSRLYTPVNKVEGHQVDSIRLGVSPNPTGTSNISVNFDELVKIEFGNIEVNVT